MEVKEEEELMETVQIEAGHDIKTKTLRILCSTKTNRRTSKAAAKQRTVRPKHV